MHQYCHLAKGRWPSCQARGRALPTVGERVVNLGQMLKKHSQRLELIHLFAKYFFFFFPLEPVSFSGTSL